MKKILLALAFSGLIASAAFAQDVATAEILGVEMTRPHSTHVFALVRDDSVGEAIIEVQALDGDGNPVAGAPVQWMLSNNGSTIAYVVGSSDMSSTLVPVTMSADVTVDGGVTDAEGRAYLVVDAFQTSDVSVAVTIGGVEAKTYRGRNMRVVWF